MPNNNPFYIIRDTYTLLFPSSKIAEVGFNVLNTNIETEYHAQITKRAWVTYHKEKFVIGYVRPNTPIFLIQKLVHNDGRESFELWNIIAEEQIGWIVVDSKTKYEPLERTT